jgi:two-component system, chemotaxis family, CheB/CheR fusion protein
LHSLTKIEKEVRSKNNHWYSARIQPYRSKGNEVGGVLLTFFDIDERRILQAALGYTQSIVDTVREPILILAEDLSVLSANRSFYNAFRVTEKETIGGHVYELGNRQFDIPGLRSLLEQVISENTQFNDYPVSADFPMTGHRRMLLNARSLYDELGSRRILLAVEDVTDRPFMDKLFSENRSGGEEAHAG